VLAGHDRRFQVFHDGVRGGEGIPRKAWLVPRNFTPRVQTGRRPPVFRQRNNNKSNGVMIYSQRTKYLDALASKNVLSSPHPR
jgi:hypothetical protein